MNSKDRNMKKSLKFHLNSSAACLLCRLQGPCKHLMKHTAAVKWMLFNSHCATFQLFSNAHLIIAQKNSFAQLCFNGKWSKRRVQTDLFGGVGGIGAICAAFVGRLQAKSEWKIGKSNFLCSSVFIERFSIAKPTRHSWTRNSIKCK